MSETPHPAPDTQPIPAANEPPPPPPVVAAPVPPERRRRVTPLVAVGLAGLLLGFVLGAVGFGIASTVWHHVGFGDDRGHHGPDNRPGPYR